MGRAGCRYVFIGFESPRQDTLDAYKKGTTGEMAREVVELLRRNNISTHASFIIGAVDETRDMAMETIRFARWLNPQAVQFSILTPYPGTKMYDDLKDRITTDDWDLYDCLNPVVRCDHLSAADLKKLVKKAYMSFYLSPRKIAAALASGLRGRGIKLSSILKIIRGTS
jgi:anaerobic magnesium-protoporphyrin IX monomethyl ester cyclase